MTYKILRVKRLVMPFIFALTAILFCIGVLYALKVSPPDYQQGEAVRIMYVHVPSSWLALGIYSFMGGMSVISFIWRMPLAALSAKAIAPIGACFAALSLATGSIWGKPMWGTWWVWDARLTSVLVLFFLYLGYIFMQKNYSHPEKGLKAANMLAIVGCINIPIIKFSVDWWHTLHQPASILRFSKPAVDIKMLIPLLIMVAAFLCYCVALFLIRLEKEIFQRKIETLQQRYWMGG